MNARERASPWLLVPGAAVLAFLVAPLVAVLVRLPPADLLAHITSRVALQALGLSLRTTLCALVLAVAFGTPLAYWLARSRSRTARVIEAALQMPVVVPPAVAGVGLLLVFGRHGWLHAGLPFTTAAVIVAQTFTGAPFFIVAAVQAFAAVDPEHVAAARTLGCPPLRAFARVTLPLARAGLLSGAALCWARALGEFGATMLFAGNYPGITQTLPLAIYTELDRSLDSAVALSALLLVTAFALLIVLRVLQPQSRPVRALVRD